MRNWTQSFVVSTATVVGFEVFRNVTQRRRKSLAIFKVRGVQDPCTLEYKGDTAPRPSRPEFSTNIKLKTINDSGQRQTYQTKQALGNKL
jgi:hypothetical protein